jgi:hypothetical protein
MSDKSTSAAGLVVFGEKLAASETFSQFFREGMGLVEETAAYLDGRKHAPDHSPDAACVVASSAPGG